MTYLEWIRTLPCGYCNDQITPTESHHLKGDLNQSGVGMKANDFLAMPLCSFHHDQFHRALWEGDWKFDQRRILILTLIHAIKEGVLVLGDIPEDDFLG